MSIVAISMVLNVHATREQFHRAYPQAREFFERKRTYDPGEVFQNRFYVEYGKP
ncbi:MAG TPA: hypothetical protein VML55_04400 [Planctomycetaceae bacterium]|nr:hypothetical protein [Planctomycetaceae bacterium]